MTLDKTDQTDKKQDEFLAQVAERKGGFFSELGAFMMQNKKWWLAPIIVCIVGLGLLVILGGTAAAPFIYTLF
jgi:hypothetical protein